MKRFYNTYKFEIILALIWFTVIGLINPIGDFPLNDDWCYGKSVKTLQETGSLKLYNWGEMSLIGQVFYGFLFTKLFGFSFTALRFSTLVLAILSSFGLLNIFRLIRLPNAVSFFCVLLCVFNPVFLELSFTYMTDIPFYTLSIYSYYFFIKHIKTNIRKYLFYAFGFCILAYSIRQLAIIYPLSFAVYNIITIKSTNLKSVLKSLFPFGLFLLFAVSFDFTLKYFEISQARYNSKFHLLLSKLLSINKSQLIYTTNMLLASLAYLGLFLSPVLLLSFKTLPKRYLQIIVPIYSVATFYILYRYNFILPSLDNIWIDFGVGPYTLYYDTAHFTQSPQPLAPKQLYYVLTLLGIVLSYVIIYKGLKVLKNLKKKAELNKTVLFTLVWVSIYLAPFLIVGVYDRYLLLLYPLAIVFMLSNFKFKFQILDVAYAVFFLVILMGFSVAATHDYLSLNRARWETLTELTEKGIPTNKIYGGAEFITWHHYSDDNKNFWEEVKPIYILTSKSIPNKTLLKTKKYSRWLPGKGVLYLSYDESMDY